MSPTRPPTGPAEGLSTQETDQPPPPMVRCTVALASVHALQTQHCPACTRIGLGEAEEEAGPHRDAFGVIIDAKECPGWVAWDALADVTGLQRR